MTKPMLQASPGRRIFLIAILILMSGIFVLPQDSSQKDTSQTGISTSSAGVEIVNAFVTVRDKKGTLIKDLTQEDFTLKEDGHKQTISNFSSEVDLPLTIGLIVDTSPSIVARMAQLQITSWAFLKNMLRPDKDKAFIMRFRDIQSGGTSSRGQVELIQGLTSSQELIEKAVKLIGSGGVAGDSRQAEYQTMLADSISVASKNILAPQKGRKVLIIIGDGFHIANHLDSAIAAAQEADALIYTVHIYDPNSGGAGGRSGGTVAPRGGGMGGTRGGRMGGTRGGGMGGSMGGSMGGNTGLPATGESNDNVNMGNLKILSSITGGTCYEGSGRQSLDQIYAQIEEELHSQYSIGYTPIQNTNNKFRTIKVEVQKPGMAVSAREGYYPRKKQ
jgi:VWFA-related protein